MDAIVVERPHLALGVSMLDPAPPGTENIVEELADPAFEQGLDAAAPGAEEAMEALEQAMEEAEARSKTAAATLGAESTPPGPAPEENDR